MFINIFNCIKFMVSIIGAGPAGNYTGYLFAKNGYKTRIFEEHKTIGKPVQCTGITTLYLGNILENVNSNEEFVINNITETVVYSPDNNYVDIKLKRNYVVDRTLFDSYFGELAKSEGAEVILGKKFIDLENNGNIKIKFNDNSIYEDNILIGADGPFSQVAKSAGIYGDRKFALGAQARIKMKEKIDSSVVEFFLGEGYFGWLVPEDDRIARVGTASMGKAKYYFDNLKKIRDGEILEWQSGPIPVYNHRLTTEKDNLYLVGDAATQVKATTYGGIIPGMMAAEELFKAVKNGNSYQKLWKKRIGTDLWIHLMMRRIFEKFGDPDYNKLIGLVNKDTIKKIITTHDREFPSKMVTKLLIREPRFLTYLKYLIPIGVN